LSLNYNICLIKSGLIFVFSCLHISKRVSQCVLVIN